MTRESYYISWDSTLGKWSGYLGQEGKGLDLLLPRATFVDDCKAAISQMCNQMDAKGAPFACVEETIVRQTPFQVFSVAFANSQFAAGIVFALLALLATRVGKQQAEREATREMAMGAAPGPAIVQHDARVGQRGALGGPAATSSDARVGQRGARAHASILTSDQI